MLSRDCRYIVLDSPGELAFEADASSDSGGHHNAKLGQEALVRHCDDPDCTWTVVALRRLRSMVSLARVKGRGGGKWAWRRERREKRERERGRERE